MQAPRTVDLVADLLRRQILQGEYPPGDRLPPERKLAETLAVNRLTLRAALSALEAEGLVRAHQGRGVAVQDWRSTGGVGLIAHLLAGEEPGLLGAFLELRRAVAVEAMAIACQRATEAQLDALSALAEALMQERDPDALAAGELDFVRQVLRMAGNLPMELLFNSVAAVYRARPEIAAAMYSDADAVRASFPAVVALLRARDPEAARRLIRPALEAIDAAALASLSSPSESKP